MPKQYLKPRFPQGWFMLVEDDGMEEGPFNPEMLTPSSVEGRPWVIVGTGRPQVFRLLRQDGDVLFLERYDARFRLHPYQLVIQPVVRDPNLPDHVWVHA
jgi:hypothetical protein